MEPIYRSDGEWIAVYSKGFLFNVDGECLGFVRGREVYDMGGHYLGFFSDDRRLLRQKRPPAKPRQQPPPPPPRPRIPSSMPLSPMLSVLPYGYIDLFEEFPDRLTFVSETRSDME
jgi:hypothetical protein